ncbi:M24 family metallopeptidase [Macrococcus lamae]|uniref:Aminopeptidase P family protein n=1 Tax=Macrococcus lamae TaxID=198484 RepID=A0A4R6BU96_9STAP|nr:Xaa-Pro peptidase family protein [Macrococcus lamae]TDM10606.1 aminopeptidase P family protein [Macrococcus lamae]
MQTEKINYLKQQLTKLNVDALWLTNPENINYFTGFLSNPHERLLALLITHDHKTLFVPKMEMQAAEAVFDGSIIGYLDTENPYKLQTFSFERIAIESEHLTVKRLEELKSNFSMMEYVSIDQTIKDVRNIKSADELEILKTAAKYADQAVEIGVKALTEGISETAVVRLIEAEMMKIDGISAMSFDTMVLFGDHASLPHGTPGNRALKTGEYVLFDLGVVYKGYCSDITRTVAFGETAPLHNQIHAIVTEANNRAIQLVKPGVRIADCDAAARDYITEQGYGEQFPHRLGHGLGISVHEFPDISSANDDVFKEGMVFTIEPGIYLEGEVGVRVEDDLVVTSNGYEVLTHYPK